MFTHYHSQNLAFYTKLVIPYSYVNQLAGAFSLHSNFHFSKRAPDGDGGITHGQNLGWGAPGGIVFLPLLIAKGEVGGKEYRKLDGPPQGKQ